MARTKQSIDQIRLAAESDLETFIKLISPKEVNGHIHSQICSWWTRSGHKSHQLTLLPRDHKKSRMIAFRVAWEITRRPWIRVLYISSTANLAEKQLKFIKDIFTNDIYRHYWPEMVNPDDGKRERWTLSEISVDHPKRREEAVRDPTIFTGGLTTNLVGMHCDIAVLDDVVTFDNAYTEEGRETVRRQYSLLSSIEGADSEEWVVGTRYEARDLYGELIKMVMSDFDDDGNEINPIEVYEIFQREVEDRGDGTGQFLWPKQQRPDGRYFGFDAKVLAKKKAQYLDKSQFYAQYYNDPNDPDNIRIDPKYFQYYDKRFIECSGGTFFFRENKLNVYAAIDFAYSLNKRADYTSIAVIGVDSNRFIYVLDIDRFKTDRISEYFDHICQLYNKWGFRKISCEITAAQAAIVKELKESYIRPNGLALSIEEAKPTYKQGTKQERIDAILKPKYEDKAVWHYQGGNCQTLEEELVNSHPGHDDISDALANAVDISVAPTGMAYRSKKVGNVIYNNRFGGVAW